MAFMDRAGTAPSERERHTERMAFKGEKRKDST